MGFPPLPQTFSPDHENWSFQSGTRGVEFDKLSVAAPTDNSAASRYRRAHINATVHHGHRNLATFSNGSGVPHEIAAAIDHARVSSVLHQVATIAREGEWDEYEDEYDGYTTKLSEAVDLRPGTRLPKNALEFFEQNDDIISAFNMAVRATIGGSYEDIHVVSTYVHKTHDLSDDPAENKRMAMFRACLRQAHTVAHSRLGEDQPTLAAISNHYQDTYLTEETARAVWDILKLYLDRAADAKPGHFAPDETLADDAWDDTASNLEWCDMDFVRPSLTLPLKSRLRRKAWRMSDEGANIRSPHRGCIDGRIFGSSRRKHDSGSVLIDCSGSMHLSDDDIDALMEMLPGVTVATYCSDGGYNGELRIVAQKGKRAAHDELTNNCMGGNGVDGPALRWLAKRPEPRYWICDGVVTGVHDSTAENLREECQMLTTKYRITRIHSMHDAKEIADRVVRR